MRLRDQAGVFDEGLLTWMPGPNSYTGEDVAEISCHGNPLLVGRLLDALVRAGARPAHPGEFTRRAFLNGRMDLTRAEAVLQAIAATSPAGLAVARAGMDGAVAKRADALRTALVDIAAELEAAIDYPGEDLLVASDDALATRLDGVAAETRAALAGARMARVAVEGARVALIGPVNAGKSSLFNALLGRGRAIVSPIPGTTRDVIESTLLLADVRIVLHDTAGERPDVEELEAAGLALAAGMLDEMDLLLVVLSGAATLDDAAEALLARTSGRPRLVVVTHADQPRRLPAIAGEHVVSSTDGRGVDDLRRRLPALITGEAPGAAAGLIASQRQHDALARLAARAEAAAEALRSSAGAAIAAELTYDALSAVDDLVGRDTREDVLDRLFSRFCVGK